MTGSACDDRHSTTFNRWQHCPSRRYTTRSCCRDRSLLLLSSLYSQLTRPEASRTVSTGRKCFRRGVTQWTCSGDLGYNPIGICISGLYRCCRNIVLLDRIAVLYVVDAVYCYRPSSVVCRFVTLVSPAKTAELIEMPFGLGT